MSGDQETQKDVPTVEELVKQLKQQHRSPSIYVGGFYLTKRKLLEKYEERIREEAMRLLSELEKQAAAKREIEEQEKARLKALDEAENLRLQDAVGRIQKYAQDVDYIDLSSEDRKFFTELSDTIALKPLDEWKPTEKTIFKFWRRLPRSIPQNIKESEKPLAPAEIRLFMEKVKESQQEQIGAMSAVRWAIVGFSIWFIIQFWLMPHLFSGR